MSNQNLEAHRVTKPIQLLAAWLVGLVSIDGAFLTAAKFLTQPDWVPALLVVAAIVNVPLFLICIFVLQTKFRPEMQEDTFYARYLEKRQITQTTENATDEVHIVRKQLLDSNARVLDFVENFQSQIDGLSGLVNNLAHSLDNKGTAVIAARQLEERVEQAKAQLALARKNAVWDQTIVGVNDLLPTFRAIEERLASAGIDIRATFGSTSEPPERPSPFIISVGSGVATENVQEVLRLIADLGVEGIECDSAPPYHSQDIYIGSYAYKVAPFAPLNEEFLKTLLNPTLTAEQFRELVTSKYSQKRKRAR